MPITEPRTVAARLLGLTPLDISETAERADGTLVVILTTGAKHTFTPDQVAAAAAAPAPEPDEPKRVKPKKT